MGSCRTAARRLHGRALGPSVVARGLGTGRSTAKGGSSKGKGKTVYVCDDCGEGSPQWHGKCPNCGEWNT